MYKVSEIIYNKNNEIETFYYNNNGKNIKANGSKKKELRKQYYKNNEINNNDDNNIIKISYKNKSENIVIKRGYNLSNDQYNILCNKRNIDLSLFNKKKHNKCNKLCNCFSLGLLICFCDCC